jgi:hypothetical protein
LLSLCHCTLCGRVVVSFVTVFFCVS